MNNYSVITLYDDDNNVAGYAAGTNLSDLVSTGWTPTASPGTALSALQAVMISDVQAMRANAETAGIMVETCSPPIRRPRRSTSGFCFTHP